MIFFYQIADDGAIDGNGTCVQLFSINKELSNFKRLFYQPPVRPKAGHLLRQWTARPGGGIVFFNYLLICEYKKNRKTEATFPWTLGYYSLLNLKWLRYVLNTLGPQIRDPHLKETHITIDYKIVILTIPYKLAQKWQPQIDVFSPNVLYI